MCNPALAVAAVSVATSAASAWQQKEAADDQLDAQNAAAKLTIQQNNKKAALDKLANQQANQKKKAAAQVGAADAGVGGNSTLRQYATLEIQGQHDEGIIESTRKGANASVEAQGAANVASYASQMAAAQGSLYAGLANAASAGINAYASDTTSADTGTE